MIPPALHTAILRELEGVSIRGLRVAASGLTDSYRGAAPNGLAPLATDAARLAYLVTRTPATFAASRAALTELRARCPGFDPHTLLDLGAGPGAGTFAAIEVFHSVDTVTLVERDPGLVALGRRLLTELPVAVRWRTGDVRMIAPDTPTDLVVLSYIAGELPHGQLGALVETAWAATSGALLVIEPGTPAGHARVLAARSHLVGAGARIVAPCPHQGPCPLGADDWCHFGVRLARTREHRMVKDAELAYEDEKFSYLAATRGSGEPAPARILRRPEHHKGHLRLSLCATGGLEQLTVRRSDREAYHAARRLSWGDAMSRRRS